VARNLALLILRATLCSLMAGHGSQKLFGWFEGYGLRGTSGWLESLGLRPGRPWAIAAGLSEFGGGVLMLLGFLNPLGPLGATGSMAMAIAKVHPLHKKPIWATSGGAELPLTNTAIASALMLMGPGKYSLDRALGIRLPRPIVALFGLVSIAAVVAFAMQSEDQSQQAEDEAYDALQGEEESEQ
jgi:putative oxidoreductase